MSSASSAASASKTLSNAPKQRPYFTYVAVAVSLLGAVYVEAMLGYGPDMAGASFLVFGPVLALGYGADWLRLQRPSLDQVAVVALLGTMTVALIAIGATYDWLPTLLMTVAGGLALSALRWALAALPRRIEEGTFLGTQDGRWLFADGDRCWTLESSGPLELKSGRRYAFRASLRPEEALGDGPFRRTQRIAGRLLEVKSDRMAFAAIQKAKARAFSRAILTCSAVVAMTLSLCHTGL